MYSKTMYELGSKRSCIRELFEYGAAQARVVGRKNVFDFSLGNPSAPPPPAVQRAFSDLLQEEDGLSLHSYTSAAGDLRCREAVAMDLNARYGTSLRPENLYFTCGAAPALLMAIRALAVEQGEFLALAPYFPEYRPFVERSGGKFTVVPADTETFQIPLQALEEALTPHTQAVLINSPNNPSGAVYTRESLLALSEILTRKSRAFGHPIYIISDEPYRELTYDGAEVPFLPTLYNNTLVCYSYSKSFSLPGERIGYVCVPDQVTDSGALYAAVAGAARILGHVCAPSLLQKVVGRCATVRPDMTLYAQNRDLLYQALVSYGYRCVKPQGAFYLFVEAPGGDANAFSDRAKTKNLLLVPGNDFGCPGFFRLSTCVDQDMIRRSLPHFQELLQSR